jgi:peroxiredoxin
MIVEDGVVTALAVEEQAGQTAVSTCRADPGKL